MHRQFLELHDDSLHTKSALAELVDELVTELAGNFGPGTLTISCSETEHTSEFEIKHLELEKRMRLETFSEADKTWVESVYGPDDWEEVTRVEDGAYRIVDDEG